MRDPAVAALYRVELEGIAEADFLECSGLKDDTEVVKYPEGGENSFVHKFIGNTEYSNITLRHGISKDSKALWQWLESIINYEKPKKVNGSIILFADDEKRTEICRWNFKNGWPCSWDGPQLKGANSALAIEVLEIAHEGFTVQPGG